VTDALVEAVTLDTAKGGRRMRAMRRQVLTRDIDRSAHSFLRALGAEPRDQKPHTRDRTL
jgi:trehalose 6-phosphate synthase